MIKKQIRILCQKILGFDRYLFLFALVTVFRIRRGNHEKAFLRFSQMIGDGGEILDIGANIGVMTVILAKKYPSTKIYAIEPLAVNRKAMEKLLRFYHIANVEVLPYAAGNRNGLAEMVMPVDGGAKMQGWSHILEPGQTVQGDVSRVPMYSLDAMAELQNAVQVKAIKIDVENFEYFVLDGARELIKKHRPLVFAELWNDGRREACFELMRSMNYRILVPDGEDWVGFDGREALDFLFLPDRYSV